MEIIENNINKPWDWYGLSYNPNLTMEFIDKFNDKPWNWEEISDNPNLKIQQYKLLRIILINLGIGIVFQIIKILI